MGIYDRQYARDDQPGLHLSAPQTMTVRIIVATAAIYFAQLIIPAIYEWGALQYDWFRRPWTLFQLLTYGFLHSPDDVLHILVNMFMLWMFGREVERVIGPRQYLGFYLTAIGFAGLVWALLQWLEGSPAQLVGASGGVAAIVALFALNFPRRQILFMFAIPMPMWVCALLLVILDINHAMDVSGTVAGTAHLAGALYGFLYFRSGVNPGLWLWDRAGGLAPKGKPRLRVHQPDSDESVAANDEVDDVLRKIKREGQESLTRRERKILEKASRQYKQRK